MQTAEKQITKPAEIGLVKQAPAPLGFVLENMNQGYRLANWLAKSALVPTALRGKPEDILVVLMTGREYGMPPMQSLRYLNVIEGRAAMSAQMMEARVVRERTVCEYFIAVESDNEKATYETKRVGWPRPRQLTYTMKDAEKAGLSGKQNWTKMPGTMLRWRAISALAREAYPDLVEGMYTEDEIEEIKARADEISGVRTAALEETLGERIQSSAMDVESRQLEKQPEVLDPDDRGEMPPEGELPLEKATR